MKVGEIWRHKKNTDYRVQIMSLSWNEEPVFHQYSDYTVSYRDAESTDKTPTAFCAGSMFLEEFDKDYNESW